MRSDIAHPNDIAHSTKLNKLSKTNPGRPFTPIQKRRAESRKLQVPHSPRHRARKRLRARSSLSATLAEEIASDKGASKRAHGLIRLAACSETA